MDPPGSGWGNSPGKVCSSPAPLSPPYPSRRVKFLVMGCHGPKAETRWSDPILLRRGTSGTAVPPRVPHTSPAGVPAHGMASALCHHPKTQRGEEVPDLPQPPYPSPFHRTIPDPPVSPHVPHPASFQPAARAPSTLHPCATAATWLSSPPSSPAWGPRWPRRCSVPRGMGAARGRARGDASVGAPGEHPLLSPISKEVERRRCF